MDLLPSSEQTEIVDSSAAFLRDRWPISRTRELFREPSNVDDAAWAAAAELGWFGLGLPESHGGIGCGLADEAVLFREIGRSVASGPFLSSVLAARVAAFGGNGALADEIVAGRRVGLVIADQAGALVLDSGTGGVLTGDVQLIDADATNADGLVLVADERGAAIFEVGALANVTASPCYDEATRLHRATADNEVALVCIGADIDPVARRGHVLAAAMLTGIAEAVRDLSAEHAKTRVQFDRPIGVNQAIKHPCADMAVRAQLSLAQTLFAAVATDEGRPDAELHALSAHVVSAEAAQLGSAATVQVMGGMGFTFEHDAHLFAKRSFVLSQFFGGTNALLGRLLELPEAI